MELSEFKDLMNQRLKENEWKGGWDELTLDELHGMLARKVILIGKALENDESQVPRLAADAANYAYMLADSV